VQAEKGSLCWSWCKVYGVHGSVAHEDRARIDFRGERGIGYAKGYAQSEERGF
jgi:hypothetical protein